MEKNFIAALAASALLAGCAIGPDYARPKVDAPAAFRFEPAAVADTADTAWWKQFGDPVLDQLIDTALANNLNVKVAAANVEQSLAVITQTRSALFPQVGYSGIGERARVPETGIVAVIPNYPNPQTAYQALLSASWEIDLWGRIRRLSESARASMLATDEARRGVILTLVSTVAIDYLTLRGLDEQLVIAKSTLGTYKESVQLYQLQFKYGQTSQMTVSQAQSQYETAAAQIPQIESQIAQTENALSVLLGRNPGPIPRGKSIYDLALPTVPAGVPSTLLERRPDLMQAEETLIAANAQIGAAKALYFPTISLTGALGSSSADLSNLFKGPTRMWNYAGQVIGPIFTFGAVSGAALLPALDPERVRRRRQRAGGQPEAEGAAGRAGAPGRGAEGLRAPGQAAVRRRVHVLLHRAAGRADAVSRRTDARRRARVGVLVGRQHVQSHGWRLDHRGGHTHHGRPADTGQRARYRTAAAVLIRRGAAYFAGNAAAARSRASSARISDSAPLSAVTNASVLDPANATRLA
jgi:multidrug efflux system outer membrane protein